MFVLVEDILYKEECEEIWIVLFGRMGIGKSVLGNIILGENVFKFLFLGFFIIKKCLEEFFVWFGYNFVIVDIFGIFDIENINE